VSLFVDTSAFYAAFDAGDGNHARAASVLADADRLITTDHVLVETCLLIQHRADRHAADRFWAGLRAGGARIEVVIEADLDNAWQIGTQFPDQGFSLVDRTSFAVMERLGVAAAATFDDHYAIYRYGPKRDRAFEIRR
jgi:predicted nucleic acid-binding protein